MSNPDPLFQKLSFDPEQVTAVNQAYDLACRTLQNIGELKVDREIIARGILQAAGSGERDATNYGRFGDLLDRTMGSNRTCPRDASHSVPCRARASCGAPGVSLRHVWGPAGAFVPRNILPAHARGRSDGSCRKGRRV